MSLYVRQSFWSYKLEIGVVTDIDNPDENYTPVAVVNNSDKNVDYFECNFSSVRGLTGAGRYIVFKNVGGTEGDLYCNNYLDDITLTYVDLEEMDCFVGPDNARETFESYAVGTEPDCWEVISADVELESATRPQVYGNLNTTADGSKSLRLKNRCVYAMPEFQTGYNVSDFTMTFNLRQPQSIYRLQVGVVDEEGNFTPVQTLKCNSTTFEVKTVSFQGYTGRIAFRNTLVPGAGMSTEYLDYSINYIDDIKLKEIESDECSAGFVIDENEIFEDFDNVCPNIQTSLTGMEPACWEVVQSDVNLSYDQYPQVYYSSDVRYVHSDYYSLRLAGRCVYALPKLADGINVQNLLMKMWVYQPESFYELTVGIWEEPQGAEPRFVPLEVINVSGEVMEEVTVVFSNYTGDGGRIAFRNTLVPDSLSTIDLGYDLDYDLDYNYLDYSYNYIDDISFECENCNDNWDKIAENTSANVIDEIGVERYLEGIVVYPNPTVGELHIGATDVQKVECYNQIGQLVAVYNNENKINISSFAEGVYTLRITVPQGVTMRKVVKR